MHNTACQLRRAGGICAADGGLAFISEDRFTAGGTECGHMILDLMTCSFLRMRSHQLGNDIARFLHRDDITQHDAFLPDKVKVVQGSACYRCSGKTDGIEYCCRGQYTGSTDRHRDLAQDSFFAFGGKFVGDRPFGRVGAFTHGQTVGKAIQLDDHAINVAGQGISHCADAFDFRNYWLGLCGHDRMGDHLKSQRTQPIQRSAVGGGWFAFPQSADCKLNT